MGAIYQDDVFGRKRRSSIIGWVVVVAKNSKLHLASLCLNVEDEATEVVLLDSREQVVVVEGRPEELLP